jgi:hypothetical protein
VGSATTSTPCARLILTTVEIVSDPMPAASFSRTIRTTSFSAPGSFSDATGGVEVRDCARSGSGSGSGFGSGFDSRWGGGCDSGWESIAGVAGTDAGGMEASIVSCLGTSPLPGEGGAEGGGGGVCVGSGSSSSSSSSSGAVSLSTADIGERERSVSPYVRGGDSLGCNGEASCLGEGCQRGVSGAGG